MGTAIEAFLEDYALYLGKQAHERRPYEVEMRRLFREFAPQAGFGALSYEQFMDELGNDNPSLWQKLAECAPEGVARCQKRLRASAQTY